MKKRVLTASCWLVVLSFVPVASWATSPSVEQGSEPPAVVPNYSGSPHQVPPGTVIFAVLTKSIETKKAKAGDEVVAQVQTDIKSKAGETLVPKDTRLVGQITEAQPRTKEQKESRLGILFDHVVLKSGGQVPLSMSIQAIADLQEDASQAVGDPTYQQPGSYSGGGMSGGGMHGGYGGSMDRQPAAAPPAGSDTGGPPRKVYERDITQQTRGVIGMPNVQLAQASGSNASVVSSDKSNIRLGSGTLLLLRVNQQSAPH